MTRCGNRILPPALLAIFLLRGSVGCVTADPGSASVVLSVARVDEGSDGSGTGPTLLVSLDDWLDPAVDLRGAFRWQAGSITAPILATWSPVARTLTLETPQFLRAELPWELALTDDRLRTVQGDPVQLPDRPVRSAELEALPLAQAPTDGSALTGAEVVVLLEARCGSCHNDRPLAQWRADALVARMESDARWLRVDAGNPGASGLLHRILPGYPLTEGTAMPPSWSDAAPLSNDELAALERWIAAGAPF